MTLALTAPTRTDIVLAAAPVRWSPTRHLRLLRRCLRRWQLAWRFMGRDARMLEDVGVNPAPDRSFLSDFLRR